MQNFEYFKNSKKNRKEDLDKYFDGLEPIATMGLKGRWNGHCLPVGCWLEFLLYKLPGIKWVGKNFISEDLVQALVCRFFRTEFNFPGATAYLEAASYRQKVSVAMIYDNFPMIDYFRKIDERTIMGIMELNGEPKIYFYLTREKIDYKK